MQGTSFALLTDTFYIIGIPKNQLQPNTHQTSQRRTLLMTTELPTELRKLRCRQR